VLGATDLKLTLRRAGLISALAIALAGCAGSSQADIPPNASAQTSSATAQPLKLPSLQPGSACPVSAQQDFSNGPGNKLPGYGFGPGPVFFSGQTQWFSGVYALILVSPAYSGKVVVRGHQLDGTNGMPFRGQQGDGNITIAPGSPGQWRQSDAIVSGAPGCYGLQVDGDNFSEIIVFSVTGGTPYDELIEGVGNTAPVSIGAGATANPRFGILSAASAAANSAGLIEGFIAGYARTTFYKQWTTRGHQQAGATNLTQHNDSEGGEWQSTAAINAILITCSGNFVDGTVASLYGWP
jgi:hypothetical protein